MIGLSIPFLTTMNEIQSFYCYQKLIIEKIPAYCTGNYEGAYAAVDLIDIIISNVDPELHKTLSNLVKVVCFSRNFQILSNHFKRYFAMLFQFRTS